MSIVIGILAAFIAVILVRAIRFTPKNQPLGSSEPIEFDRQAAIDALAQLIRCKTVSYSDHSLEDDAEFEKLIGLLPGLYPKVFEVCSMERLPDRALLLRWPGKRDAEPVVLMAHYDVVPADEEKWEKPPFAAILEEGVLWGRGTLDTKVTFNGVLSAADHLIGEGFTPEHDVYFAFSGGEEIHGQGAANIVDYFEENNQHKWSTDGPQHPEGDGNPECDTRFILLR